MPILWPLAKTLGAWGQRIARKLQRNKTEETQTGQRGIAAVVPVHRREISQIAVLMFAAGIGLFCFNLFRDDLRSFLVRSTIWAVTLGIPALACYWGRSRRGVTGVAVLFLLAAAIEPMSAAFFYTSTHTGLHDSHPMTGAPGAPTKLSPVPTGSISRWSDPVGAPKSISRTRPAQDSELVEQIKARLATGLTQREVGALVTQLAGEKAQPHKTELYLASEFVPDFAYRANDGEVVIVCRYFLCENQHGTGQTDLRYRLNLMYVDARLRKWYTRED
jgi:hypothetical protein